MRKAIFAGLVCAAVLLAQTKPASVFTPTVAAPELHLDTNNFTFVLRQLYTYSQTNYEREITQVVAPAHEWLQTRTSHVAPNEKLAVVFDIDETLLSNLPNMLDCGFCSSSLQAKLYSDRPLPAIPQVRDLYNFAKSKGLAIFVLTGRSETGRDQTEQELRQAGFTGYQELLMRLNGDSKPASEMKAGVRQGIERKGYKIILNIGDQLSDLSGGFSERTYKLPDPFYFVE